MLSPERAGQEGHPAQDHLCAERGRPDELEGEDLGPVFEGQEEEQPRGLRRADPRNGKVTQEPGQTDVACTSRMWDIDLVKAAHFHGAARAALRAFPEDVRRAFGKAIYDLQSGHALSMPLSRPMPNLGSGAAELRVRGADGIYRAFYCTFTGDSIMIFHAFVKKTQRTPARELALGRRRLKEMLP